MPANPAEAEQLLARMEAAKAAALGRAPLPPRASQEQEAMPGPVELFPKVEEKFPSPTQMWGPSGEAQSLARAQREAQEETPAIDPKLLAPTQPMHEAKQTAGPTTPQRGVARTGAEADLVSGVSPAHKSATLPPPTAGGA